MRKTGIDCSQTLNRFTLLDADPLPNVEYIMSYISKFNVCTTIDLQCMYYQIQLVENERQFTAYGSCEKLY